MVPLLQRVHPSTALPARPGARWLCPAGLASQPSQARPATSSSPGLLSPAPPAVHAPALLAPSHLAAGAPAHAAGPADPFSSLPERIPSRPTTGGLL